MEIPTYRMREGEIQDEGEEKKRKRGKRGALQYDGQERMEER